MVDLRRDVPVFAFSIDLGTIKLTSSPVTWSLGYVRDPSVQYTAPSGAIESRRPYYVMQYPNISAAVSAHSILTILDGT